MKICILGNSHAAALKHGWDRIAADYRGVNVHFYTMLGQNLGALELDGRHLVKKGGRGGRVRHFPPEIGEAVDLDLYDGFILHGLGLNFRSPDGPGLSAAVREAVIVDSLQDTALWKLLGVIREVSGAPARVGPTPLRAAENVKTRGPSPEFRAFVEKLRLLCEERNAVVVPQPDETIVNGAMTDPKFNMDVVPIGKDPAEKMGANERHTDRSHMNPEFGVMMMTRYLESF